MARQLSLEVSDTGPGWRDIDGFRVRITVAAQDMPPEVFRYFLAPMPPGAVEPVYYCDGVCSPADMEAFPAGAPAPGDAQGRHRLNVFDAVFPSAGLAKDAIATIRLHAARLVASLNALDVLATPTTIIVTGSD